MSVTSAVDALNELKAITPKDFMAYQTCVDRAIEAVQAAKAAMTLLDIENTRLKTNLADEIRWGNVREKSIKELCEDKERLTKSLEEIAALNPDYRGERPIGLARAALKAVAETRRTAPDDTRLVSGVASDPSPTVLVNEELVRAVKHAHSRFVCLAEDFAKSETGGVDRAMCETDAEIMSRTLSRAKPSP